MKFISITFITTRQQKRRVSHAAPPHPNSHPSPPAHTKKRTQGGCPSPFYSAGATDKSCLQSISVKGYPTPFYMLSHLPTSSATELISSYSATLPPRRRRGAWGYAIHTVRHHKIMVPEVWIAYRKALSPIGVGRYGFYRTGVVMDWSNKSDEIYFNHFYYNKTTKTACFTRRTTPPQLAPIPPRTHKKKELKQCEYLSSRK